jgi:hypothetical protein
MTKNAKEIETPKEETPKEEIIKKYIESLTPIEKQTYLIAKEHLGSSFSIENSIGFIEFMQIIPT